MWGKGGRQLTAVAVGARTRGTAADLQRRRRRTWATAFGSKRDPRGSRKKKKKKKKNRRTRKGGRGGAGTRRERE